MESVLSSFNIRLKINSGAEIEYLITSLEKDLKIVFDVFFENQKISNIGLDDQQCWTQRFGTLLPFEIEDIGFAIEQYYQNVFSNKDDQSIQPNN
ncbi:hypothetical protein ABIB40_003998 [Pedobacter sp. UYP30]|uniref:hypothetical protein n=1 Tax=Pedobacter sp. UYP30 TaxID=1756400 RepID=UPI003393E9E5